jgi:hypothetical protein
VLLAWQGADMLHRLSERRRKRRVDADWARISKKITADAQQRRELLVGQEAMVQHLEALLFRIDPIGINFEENTDEYRAEAETITLRRAEARNVDEVRRIVHEEFVRWFDAKTAGPAARYQSIAADLWAFWQQNSGG